MHLKLRNQSQIHIQTVINKTSWQPQTKNLVDTHTEKKRESNIALKITIKSQENKEEEM